jgi:Amt family ammonium transporter
LKTIAEFVENSEILSLLGEIGVDYAQGYHLGKPTPISDLLKNSVEPSHQDTQAVV